MSRFTLGFRIIVTKQRALRFRFGDRDFLCNFKFSGFPVESPVSFLSSNSMVYFLRQLILHGRRTISAVLNHSSNELQFCPSSLLVSRKCISHIADTSSIVASYLVNSCGFTPKNAENAARRVDFKNPNKADSVIAFLKDRGFSETQIFTVIRKLPEVLICKPEKTLLPKFDFFYSKGILNHEMAELLCKYPPILKVSLRNQLIPLFIFLTNLFESEEKTVAAIKDNVRILRIHLQKNMSPTIDILRQNGVPESNILKVLRDNPRIFSIESNRFKEIVEEVKRMGFDPLQLKFVLAIVALSSMSKTTWAKKFDCYKKWGWSDEDIILAFGRMPWCMMLSEKKITEGMNYFTNGMGLKPSLICKTPGLLLYSLNKRLIPRGSVGKVLLSKGLIKEGYLGHLFAVKEESFLKMIVKRYEKEAPKLLKLYKDELNLSKKPESEISIKILIAG